MLVYLAIFCAKLLEVAITTVRVVLTSRGNRVVATLLATVEITIWLIVASNVLMGIMEDPLRAVAYGLAFALGIFFGIALEDKLALGLSQIEVIAECEVARLIAGKLRDHSYGVTTYECEGLEGKKLTLELKVLRKDIPITIELLKEYDQLFVTVTDIRKLSMGNISRRNIIK